MVELCPIPRDFLAAEGMRNLLAHQLVYLIAVIMMVAAGGGGPV